MNIKNYIFIVIIIMLAAYNLVLQISKSKLNDELILTKTELSTALNALEKANAVYHAKNKALRDNENAANLMHQQANNQIEFINNTEYPYDCDAAIKKGIEQSRNLSLHWHNSIP